MVLLTWLGIEAIAALGHLALSGRPFPKSAIKAAMRSAAGEGGDDRAGQPGAETPFTVDRTNPIEVIHPYFGYVADPIRSDATWRTSPEGFYDPDGDAGFGPRSPDRWQIGFFGGSFGVGTFLAARSGLPECLASTGRDVAIRNYSAGGYKQPQQLLILSYLLATGSEFDVIVNVDGFNEVALTYFENVLAGVHPFFPRRWNDRVSTTLSPDRMKKLARLAASEDARAGLARRFYDHALYRSPALALVWQAWDRSLVDAIQQARSRLRGLEGEGAEADRFQRSGPAHDYTSPETLYPAIAALWENASVQMATLAEGQGARFLHVLQPNQYLEGTKPMSDAERAVAVQLEHPFVAGVLEGYPRLIEAGRGLRARGIEFLDLTRVYEDHPEPLYRDTCCHVNDEGYRIVVERICEAILSGDEASVADRGGESSTRGG